MYAHTHTYVTVFKGYVQTHTETPSASVDACGEQHRYR